MFQKTTKNKIIVLKEIFLLIFMLILFLLIVFWNSVLSKKRAEVCFNDNCFNVEIAENRIKAYIGLMFRRNLEENGGMLFVFNEPENYYFWMKNVKMPLDIIFMDENKKVAHLNKNAQPCQQKECPNISADQPVKYVLEINAGQAEKSNIKNGDQLVFKNFKYPL